MIINVLNELMRREVFRNEMDGEIIFVNQGKLIVKVNRDRSDDLVEMIDVISCGLVEYTLGQLIDERAQMMFEEVG